MNIINLLLSNIRDRMAGNRAEFEDYLKSGNIGKAKDLMTCNNKVALETLKEYVTDTHKINYRPDKIVSKKSGEKSLETTWKLPVAYQVYINEIALVFLYGRPVKWQQLSEGTDNAFSKYLDVIKESHFDARIREAKRIAGAETESALLFRVYKDDDGPNMQIFTLAASKGHEIYVKWDEYEQITAVGWGRYVKESGDNIVYHFDVFTPDTIYRCAKRTMGWDVAPEVNLIGKIPVILFQQEKEWVGAEQMINRMEHIVSRTADTNDYYADPTLLVAADVVKNMPDKKEAAKVLVTSDADGVNNAARFLTWDSAPQSKKDEMEWLHKMILQTSFTPEISLDTMKSVSQLSAKALRTVMMLAVIKANRRKEKHDELLDRTASLLTAIIGNVLDVSLSSECANLSIGHEYQEPFGDDITDTLEQIIKSVDAGIMSTESALEQNPLVKDIANEKQRLAEEKEASRRTQLDIFGAGTAYDGGENKKEEGEDKKEEGEDK